MSRFEEIKFWIKDNPKIAFIVGMVLFAVLISFVSAPARPSVPKQIQEVNTTVKQETKAAEEEAAKPKLGLKPMINGDLMVTEINPADTAISGMVHPTVLQIEATDKWLIKDLLWSNSDKQKFAAKNPDKTGLIMIPVAEYNHIKFLIEQPFVANTNIFHDTEISILLDGTEIKSFALTPDTMLTKPIAVDINTRDKGMLTVKIRVGHSFDDKYFYIKNPYPIWICDPVLTKEGEGDAQ